MTLMQYYEWRAFIGPAYEPDESATHYDWSAIWLDGIDPDTAATTLTATLAAGATSITVADPATLRSKGGAWIGPNGATEGWEYVSYASLSAYTMGGIVREPLGYAEHDRVHTSGAAVVQWWKITGDNGRLHFAESIDQNLSAITWQAEIAGIRAPAPAMRANHLIIVQTRANVGAWSNTLIGFCRQPRIRDAYERLREWSLEIICAGAMIDRYRSKAVRVGAMNLAEMGSAATDTCLVDPGKERMAGDYVASAPTLTGGSAIDGNDETLWIAERLRASTINSPSLAITTDPGSNLVDGLFCTMAKLHRLPGEPKGRRYFEFVACAQGRGLRQLPDAWLCSKDRENAARVGFGNMQTSAGDLIILAENKATFEANNPISEAIATIEIGSAFFDGLDLAGDAIALRIMQLGGGNFFPTVAWGTGGTPQRINDGATEYGTKWDTDTIAAPTPGQIIRYDYYGAAVNKNEHFKVDYTDAPGYRSGGDDPWIQIALPVIGLSVRDDITDVSPAAGESLYVTKGDADGTEGLTTSGTIQIGTEQITYSARAAEYVTIAARGANSTTPAYHAAGDMIRVIDTDGIATQGQLISRIGWTRPTGFPYPQAFTFRRSNLDAARVPSDDNHTDDYETLDTQHTHASNTYSLTLSPARRMTYLILEIDHMSVDPYRPRVNEVQADAADAMFDLDLVMAPDSPEAVIGRVILNTGFNGFALDITESAWTIDDLITAEDASAWTVVADLAAKTNVLVDCERAGMVAVAPNTLPAATLTPATTWSEINASACEFVQTTQSAIAQMILPYRLPDGTEGESRYPATPASASGQIVTLDQVRYPDANTAAAAVRRAYVAAAYPVTMLVECAEEQPTLRPGAVARVKWQYADDTPTMDRTTIVVGADHEISGGIWTTVLTTKQVDREWAA